MQKEKFEQFLKSFSADEENQTELTPFECDLRNEFLSQGQEVCSQQIRNQKPIGGEWSEHSTEFISGWRLWQKPMQVNLQYRELLLDLVWECFEFERKATRWHPWVGHDAPWVELPKIWVRGYFRYIYRTGDFWGIGSVVTCTVAYKNNFEFYSHLQEVLGVEKSRRLMHGLMQIDCEKEEFVEENLNKEIAEIVYRYLAEEEPDGCFVYLDGVDL